MQIDLRASSAFWRSLGALTVAGTLQVLADGPGISNIDYPPERVGEILSIINPQKAVSGTALHRGYLFVPLGADHGGGLGDGAFAFYDVSNPSNPVSVLDSRNDAARYHTAGTLDYVGDWAEIHHLPISGDLMLMSERRSTSAGFSIFDVSPLHDSDPNTKPRTVARYSFPGITGATNYDGYSFAIGWQGRRYVYAPTGAQGLYVIDTTDMNNPVQIKHMSRSALGNVTMRAAWPIGNILILAEGNIQGTFTAKVFDISVPSNPVELHTFSGPFGYHGFVYGSAFYGGATPIARHDFTNPMNVVRTDLYANPGFDRPEYGYGKDGHLFIGHYPGATKWKLEGNTAIPAGRVDSGLVDDHAFLNPLGNLVLLCSDHNNDRKIMIGVHDTAKDLAAPVSMFTSPANGATGQNVLSRVGISFSDLVDPSTVNSGTVVVRKFSTGAQVAGSYSVMMGIVNFAPDAPLDPNTTYDVLLTAGGVRDQAGNAVPDEIRISRFSTGSALNDYSTAVAATTPREVGVAANFTLNVTNKSGLTLEHSWDFGDGTASISFSTATTSSHVFTNAGNHIVRVKTRIAGQTYAPTVNAVQVVHRPIPAMAPVNGTTIVVDPARALVWNVNKDNNTVSSIDSVNHVRTREVTVGNKPSSLALGPNDTLWVVNKGSASISVINRASGAVTATYFLPPGSAPHGIVVDSAAGFAYVSQEGTGQVAKIQTSNGSVVATLAVGPWPRGLTLDASRQRLWVSRFISPDEGGKLVSVNLSNFTTASEVPLAPVFNADSLQNGRGIPNYLGALAISPDLTQGYVPAKKDNIYRGTRRDGLPLTFEHTVRSMAANLDLATGTEMPGRRLDFDNSDFATAAVFSPLGNMVFFATSGSATIWAADAYNPASIYSLNSGGQAPDGMAVSADGTRLYIHNFMDRSVTVLRTSAACSGVCGTVPQLAKVGTVNTEQLPAQVLKGKQLFYGSSDPRLAQEGYMSCASCHLDGGQDGRTWDFTNLGEGLRNTIDLNGRGVGHGPLHWTANFDEFQDFEGQIRQFAQGSGLTTDSVFHRGSRAMPLGESKAGLSEDLDALAAYLGSLTPAGRSPHRQSDGALNASAIAGKEIFSQENCAACHGGGAFSDSASLTRHDVGTLTAASGARLGQALDGLDTPTLRGLWSSAPYLHDGSAATLRDVLVARNPGGLHGNLSDRSSLQIDQLVSYLQSIDDLETTAPTTATGNGPVLASPGIQSHSLGQSVNLLLSSTGSGLLWESISLPPGLSINATGRITGAPTQAGAYTARVGVRDASGRSSAVSFAWTVIDPAARRHVKLASLSSHNGAAYSSLADFTLLGADGRSLDRGPWTATASSEQASADNGAANAIDPHTSTIWHTLWSGTAFPHHLAVDMKNREAITGFTCLPRQDGNGNGRIKDYQFFWSSDGVNWGGAVAQGTFPDNGSRQIVLFDRDADGFTDYFEGQAGSDPLASNSQPSAFHAGLVGWWKLDEPNGAEAIDSAALNNGTLVGQPSRVTGISGAGVRVNGSTQSVRLPVQTPANSMVTVSAWIKREGAQVNYAGIAFTRDNGANGLNFRGTTNQLGYHWNSGQYNFASNLTVPDGVWTFCALVVEPAKATLYMKPAGGSMQTAVNNTAHAPMTFGGNLHLGQDPAGGRSFKGALDDVRFYGRSLSSVEVASIATLPNRAPEFATDPLVGSPAVAGSVYAKTLVGRASDQDGNTLSFTKLAGPAWLTLATNGTLGGTPALSDLGVNSFTVRVTDGAGGQDEATLNLTVTHPQQPDGDGDGFADGLELALGTDPGSAASVPDFAYNGLRGWWRLNEGSGTSTADSSGRIGQTGTLVNAPIWTSGTAGSGLEFNGTSQAVRIPPLASPSNTFTTSAWVNRSGNQNDWAGIVYAWQSGPASGMMFGPSNQLRYTWNGDHYGFSSGLTVPDNVWTFCGLVVEPGKATLYMMPAGGAMQVSVHINTHGVAPLAGDLYLGRDAGVSTRYLKGKLDEARVFGRPLNAAEMQFMANATSPPAASQLPLAASYHTWLAANGLPEDGSGVGEPGTSANGDGVSNALKFALGLPASSAGYAGRVRGELGGSDAERYNTLTYTRPEPAPEGKRYVVEVCGDLLGWNAEETEEISNTLKDGLRTVTTRDRVPAGKDAPSRFIRLRVSP